MFGAYRPFPAKLGGGKPLARIYEENLQAAYPDALKPTVGSLLWIKTLTLARMGATTWEALERYQANLVPGTSYELLLNWAKRLGVVVRDSDTVTEIRNACAAKYLINTRGANEGAVYDVVKTLLGDMLVSINYNTGSDLDTPPDDTYWSQNPGSVPWSSSRALVEIVAAKPATMSQDSFDFLMNVRLYNLLDILLPAWVSWHWTQS